MNKTSTDPFYLDREWHKTRSRALRANRQLHGGQLTCVACSELLLTRPNVDHIVRRKVRPDLAHELSNLQVLCQPCHSGIKRISENAEARPTIGLDGLPDSWR